MAVNENKNLNRPINKTTTHHAILILSLLFLSPTLPAVNGQQASPGSPDPYPYANFSPSMAIIIGVLVTALFFMGFFSIYIRRCSESSSGGVSIRPTLSLRSRRAAAARGLDASVIETFPTLAYSEVKDLKIGKDALECAVCLNEFEGDETLRLLPKCDHVFHPECIDLWLASHVTCPVCRADLVPKPGESAYLPDGLPNPESETSESNNNIVEVHTQGEFHVTIIPDEDQVLDSNNLQEPPRSRIMKRNGSLLSNRPPRSGSVRSKLFGFGNKFSRSHSTGHSLVQLGETYDRFTLRLPAEVRKEVIKRALLNPTGSCAAAGLACEQSGRKGYRTGNGTGEGGSSRGRSYRQLGSLEGVKSDRWVFSRMPSFLTRALSVSSPKVVADGEASTSAKTGGNPLVKIDEAVLVANDSAKLRV